MNSRRTSIFLEPEDDAAIQRIREKYRLNGASDAIRLAIRIVAQEQKNARVHYDPRRRKAPVEAGLDTRGRGTA